MGTMPGANAQISFPLSDRWSLVGELNVASGRECDGCDRRFNDFSVLGGVRANWWPTRRVSVSTQVLAGGLHSRGEGYSWSTTFANGRTVGGYEEAFTVNYVAVQPGAGATLMITPRIGIRLQTDLQVAIPDQDEFEGISVFPRTVVGTVIRLGPR